MYAAVLLAAIAACPTVNGYPLQGRVRLVAPGLADVRLQGVEQFASHTVWLVNREPRMCGELQIVSFGEDYTVAFVAQFADLRVRVISQ